MLLCDIWNDSAKDTLLISKDEFWRDDDDGDDDDGDDDDDDAQICQKWPDLPRMPRFGQNAKICPNCPYLPKMPSIA